MQYLSVLKPDCVPAIQTKVLTAVSGRVHLCNEEADLRVWCPAQKEKIVAPRFAPVFRLEALRNCKWRPVLCQCLAGQPKEADMVAANCAPAAIRNEEMRRIRRPTDFDVRGNVLDVDLGDYSVGHLDSELEIFSQLNCPGF